MKMVDKTPLDDTALDAFFDAARAQDPTPSDDLIARILADADAEVIAQSQTAAPPRRGWFAQVVGGLGGWPALAGLATAAVTGVTIGVVSPDVIDTWTDGTVSAALGYEVNDLLPSVGGLLDEG